jgi:hypothetical protein
MKQQTFGLDYFKEIIEYPDIPEDKFNCKYCISFNDGKCKKGNSHIAEEVDSFCYEISIYKEGS